MTKADIFIVIGALRSSSVEPDQTAPGSTLFLKKAFKQFQQMTKVDVSCCDWRYKGKSMSY